MNKITHEGELDINGLKIPCYMLEDGTRILSTSGMQKALGVTENEPTQRSSKRLDEILSSKAVSRFMPDSLISSKLSPITCYKGDQKIIGYEATALPDLCEVMLKARDYASQNGIELGTRQKLVIIRADILMRGLAIIGILSLIDDATGYKNEREHLELQKILNAYISQEIIKWQLTFTDEFYQQVFRLWGLKYTPESIKVKPSFIGKLTLKYIYEQLPPGVLDKIIDKTPKSKGGYHYKLHQSLTPEIGREHLKKQIIEVTTLMSIASTKEEFVSLFEKKYRTPAQIEIDPIENKDKDLSAFNKALKKGLDYNPKEDKNKD